MLFVTAVAAAVWAPDRIDRHDILIDLAGASFYVRNWMFGSANVLVYHTWTLGLEEQFYLVWPPILVLFYRRRRLRSAVVVVAGLSWQFVERPALRLKRRFEAVR